MSATRHVRHLFCFQLVCDGGFSSNIPFGKDPNVITVSPFSGGCDICPQGESPVVMVVHPVDQPLQLSMENLSRLLNSLNPSSWDYLEKLFHLGYEDSLRFLMGEGVYVCVCQGCHNTLKKIKGIVDRDSMVSTYIVDPRAATLVCACVSL